jgi:hypothetical protein
MECSRAPGENCAPPPPSLGSHGFAGEASGGGDSGEGGGGALDAAAARVPPCRQRRATRGLARVLVLLSAAGYESPRGNDFGIVAFDFYRCRSRRLQWWIVQDRVDFLQALHAESYVQYQHA